MDDKPLWTPPEERREASNLRRFLDELNAVHGLALAGYDNLHAFSIEVSCDVTAIEARNRKMVASRPTFT